MPLFMDVHDKVDGLTAEAVAGAHQRDLEVQGRYGVDYRQYWFDESSGKVAAIAHRDGLLPTGWVTQRPIPGGANVEYSPDTGDGLQFRNEQS